MDLLAELSYPEQVGAWRPSSRTEGNHQVQGEEGNRYRAPTRYVASIIVLHSRYSRPNVIGAAIGLLDAVYLPLHIPNITTRFVGYGLPRVGNRHFADYVDAHPSISVTHINNKEDIVPILPGRFLGFHHPSGEVHIQESGAWLACPGRCHWLVCAMVGEALNCELRRVGQDNTNAKCTVGDVRNLFVGDGTDHDGPYDGIEIGCSQ